MNSEELGSRPKGQQKYGLVLGLILLGVSFVVSYAEIGWKSIWPSAAALCVVLVSRSAIIGLATGALCGAVIVSQGSLLELIPLVVFDLFLPIFDSPWKVSAILFTLILGGFVALLEAGGGLVGLLRVLSGKGVNRKRSQFTVSGFGLVVFFDGLANSMLVGRLMRSIVDRCGVSRVKLAYLADTTSSAVACLAFISTWIAFQLSMIREGYEIVGRDVNPYQLFFQSLPANFYCWFSLFLVVVCISRGFNPGPMARYEAIAKEGSKALASSNEANDNESENHWLVGVLPLGVLVLSVPVLSYVLGAEELWPFSLVKFAEAYGAAEKYVPQILVSSSIVAAITAALAYKFSYGAQNNRSGAISVFLSGARDLLKPALILLAAWMLGSVTGQLGAADYVSSILQGRLAPEFLPVAIFLTGALISFTTGTSWGTMGVLMPLAIPVVFSVSAGAPPEVTEHLVIASIGAVFSGAVFGDHCSPLSDTTLVSSIAAGVDPFDHVKTQLPFALIAASLAGLLGFIPLGLGFPSFLLLGLGLVVLFFLPFLFRYVSRSST